MKKISLLFILLMLTTAISASAITGNWLLYLPAILAGNSGGEPPVVEPEKSGILLYLPAILAGALKTPAVPYVVVFNDTGITDCVGGSGEEDCNYGLDVTDCDETDGHAGFSFTKLDSDGGDLANQAATSWSCVRDNVTGLIWEVKTNDSGLHGKDHLYSWYNTDPNTNGGADGADYTTAACDGSPVWLDEPTYCNTEAYVNRVNAVAGSFCGATDWRMPTVKELQGIVSYDRSGWTVDENYFPSDPAAKFYWSGVSASNDTGKAWTLNFSTGLTDYFVARTSTHRVRLVRNAPVN